MKIPSHPCFSPKLENCSNLQGSTCEVTSSYFPSSSSSFQSFSCFRSNWSFEVPEHQYFAEVVKAFTAPVWRLANGKLGCETQKIHLSPYIVVRLNFFILHETDYFPAVFRPGEWRCPTAGRPLDGLIDHTGPDIYTSNMG